MKNDLAILEGFVYSVFTIKPYTLCMGLFYVNGIAVV